MAEEEIELSYFNSSALKVSTGETTAPMSESHSHAGQTLAAPSLDSNFTSTISAITSGSVAGQQVRADTHSHHRGSNLVRYVTPLHDGTMPGNRVSKGANTGLSSQHGTVPVDRVNRVTHTGLSPQHGTVPVDRVNRVTHTGLSLQHGTVPVDRVNRVTHTGLSPQHGTVPVDRVNRVTHTGLSPQHGTVPVDRVNRVTHTGLSLQHGTVPADRVNRVTHTGLSLQHGTVPVDRVNRVTHTGLSLQDGNNKMTHTGLPLQHGAVIEAHESQSVVYDVNKDMNRLLRDGSCDNSYVSHVTDSGSLGPYPNTDVFDVQTYKDKQGEFPLGKHILVNIPSVSDRQLHNSSQLHTNIIGNICESLQLSVNSEIDTSQLNDGNAAVSGSEIMYIKDPDEENNINYSNRKKRSKRQQPKVDSFVSSISAPGNNRSANRRSAADGQSVTATSTSRSGAFSSSRRSVAASNKATHNLAASSSGAIINEGLDDESETRSTDVESSEDAEDTTGSTNVESSDDAEDTTRSTNEESSDDAEDTTRSTKESPDEAESETSSPKSESQDDAESKAVSSSEESHEDTDSKTMSTSEESPDDSEGKTMSTGEESPDSEGKASPGSDESPDDSESKTSSTGGEGSTISEEEENEDSPDGAEKEVGSNSSSSSPDEEDKKQRKKIKKRKGFFTKMMKSAPDEQWLMKMVLWFPVGIGMSVALYFLVIQKMSLSEKYKLIIGCGVGLVLSLTFAFSVQMRCVMTLVVPTFVGKAGRSYFAAFAIVYLVNGPITNIMDNCEEIVRSMTCNSELTANHSKTKFNLRMHPVQHAVGDILKDNFLVVRASKAIKKAFSPLTKEIKENEDENRQMESSIKDVEKMGNKQDSVVDKIDNNFKDSTADKDAGVKVEKQWEKKMDLRCQGTFSHGVQRCRDKMGELYDKCMDTLSFLGYLVCWPLKITVFCNLVKLIPGVVGLDCNAASQVSPGFGNTYLSARDVMDNMESGANVNLQYKVVGSADANYMPVEEMRQATMHEVKAKTDTINITLKVITHLLTFTFLIVFYGAYKYNSKYLTDLNWDNKYITAYFRHIDARRKDRGKRTLLPLKKAEKKELYDPNKLKLSAAERKKVVSGTIQLLLRVVISAIICYMDSIFYQVLDIIARNSKIEYHQTGEHVVDIKIYGKGFMSALVRSFLERFNSKQDLDSLTTNYACLPRPSKTDIVILSFIFGTYMLVWVFLYFEAFGLRMRRVIAAFYYRKREKKRVLYLYNERYRKRVGFLMHMRKKVRKELRDREFQRKIGMILALKRQFPFLSKCLGVLKASKDTCIICGELEAKGFHTCPTEGCGVGYCRECWIDIKKKCYACGQVSDDDDEDSGSDSETADDGQSSPEDSD